MRILLDDEDVTVDTLTGPLGNSASPSPGVVFPDKDVWIDLLPAIENNATLKKDFFKPGIHTLKIVDDGGSQSATIFIKSKYSTRNR